MVLALLAKQLWDRQLFNGPKGAQISFVHFCWIAQNQEGIGFASDVFLMELLQQLNGLIGMIGQFFIKLILQLAQIFV